MRELELRLNLLEPISSVKQKMKGFHCKGTEHILDIQLQHPGMPQLLPVKGELLQSFRLRRKGLKNILTWKKDNIENGRTLYTDEEEVEVSSFEDALKILTSLGFHELVRIENERTTYTAEEYEIAVDDVKGLGPMIEVEHKNPGDRNNAEVFDEMREFLTKAGIHFGEELKLNKPERMLRKMGRD